MRTQRETPSERADVIRSENRQMDTLAACKKLFIPLDFSERRKVFYALAGWLNVSSADRSAAVPARPPETCGVVGEPEAGRCVCELPKGHEGESPK